MPAVEEAIPQGPEPVLESVSAAAAANESLVEPDPSPVDVPPAEESVSSLPLPAQEPEDDVQPVDAAAVAVEGPVTSALDLSNAVVPESAEENPPASDVATGEPELADEAIAGEAPPADPEISEVDPEVARRRTIEALTEQRRLLNAERPVRVIADHRVPITPVERRSGNLDNIAQISQILRTSVEECHQGMTREQMLALASFTGNLGGGALSAGEMRALGDFPDLYMDLARKWGREDAFEPNEAELAAYGETRDTPDTPAKRQALLYRLELNSMGAVTDEFAQGLWAMAERMGFQSGRVVLANSGPGTLSRMRPDNPDLRVTQVPNEPFAAEIAQRLFPEDAVVKGRITNVVLPGNYYDLALAVSHATPEITIARGLKPYAQDDSINIETDTPPLTETEHLLYKTLKTLRPGGIAIAVVPSTSLLDMSLRAEAAHARIARNGEVIMHSRVPGMLVRGPEKDALNGTRINNDDAFTAGDHEYSIVVLRARPEILSEEEGLAHWKASLVFGQDTLPLDSQPNARIAKAEMNRDGVYEGDPEYVTRIFNAATGDVMAALLNQAPREALAPTNRAAPDRAPVLQRPGALQNEAREEANGVFVLAEGNNGIHYRLNGQQLDHEVTPEQMQKLMLLIPLRDLVREALDHQQVSNDDDKLAEIQSRLNRAYDAFVNRFGPVLHPDNRAVFERDSFAPSLAQLEIFNEETGGAEKTSFFTERVLRRHTLIERADSPQEALSLSMGRVGYVSPPLISSLLQRPWDEVHKELAEEVFLDPLAGRFVTRSQYLSGPVRAKLQTALNAEVIDPELFYRNAPALRTSLPKLAAPEDIGFMMGAPWIPVDDYRRFISERLRVQPANRAAAIKIAYDALSSRYSVNIDIELCDVAAIRDYTSDETTPRDIFEANLNGRSIRVFMDDPNYVRTGEEKEKVPRVADHAATAQVHVYQERVRDEFVQWCTERPDRAERLARIYNERVNAYRDRAVSGDYLRFEMCSPRWVPMSQQRDAVARFIEDGNLLAAHGLGTGKTFTEAACAIESVRMGLHSKAVMVTPKNTFAQTAAQVIQAYPTAKVLLAETLSPRNKAAIREFVARASMDQWDLILMTYDSFKAVSLSSNAQIKVWQRKLAETVKEAVKEFDPNSPLNRRQTTLNKRIRDLGDKAGREHHSGDDQWGFERIGCDLLIVDEAQNFKNIDVSTKMNVLGITSTGSDRARDLEAKIDHVRHFNGNNRGVVMGTATPICNSIAEIYTMMSYVNPMVLRSMGIRHFDAWAATFGRVQSLIEQKPAGDGFQIRDRFIRFQNVPEMIRSFRMVADLRLDDDLVDQKVTRPNLRNILVTSPKSVLDDAILKSLEVRARGLEKKEKLWSKDSVIVIMGDLRRAMLDPRLVDPRLPAHGTEIINQAADVIARKFEETTDIRGTQFVFLDQGVNPRPFSLYEELREQLVQRGLPRNQIALITEYAKTNERHRLIQRFNDGRIRVLVGSSTKIGVGMNAQKHCVAMHEVDIPYRPDLLIQRLGRGHRPGNQNAEVENYVYGKQGQTRMFEIIYNKALAINQAFRDPDKAARNLDEELDVSLENIQVELTENNLLRDKVRVDSDLKHLQLQKTAHLKSVAGFRLEAERESSTLRSIEERSAPYRSALEVISQFYAENKQRQEADLADRAAAKARLDAAREAFRQARDNLSCYKEELIALRSQAIDPANLADHAVAGGEPTPQASLIEEPTTPKDAPVLDAEAAERDLSQLTGEERRKAVAQSKRDYKDQIDRIFLNRKNEGVFTSKVITGRPDEPSTLTKEQDEKLGELVRLYSVANKEGEEARSAHDELERQTPGLRITIGDREYRSPMRAGEAIFHNVDQMDFMRGYVNLGVPEAIGRMGPIAISVSCPVKRSFFACAEDKGLYVSPDTHLLNLNFDMKEQYRGTVHLTMGDVRVSTGLNINGLSNSIRMMNLIQKVEESINGLQQRTDALRASVEDLTRRAEVPFPREAELQELARRKLDIDTELLNQQAVQTPEVEAAIMLPVLDAVHFKTGRPVHPDRLRQWHDANVGLDEAVPEDDPQEAEDANQLARQIIGAAGQQEQPVMAPVMGNG